MENVEVLSMPMLLGVHAWAREVHDWDTKQQAERELEDLVLLGKGKVRQEPEEPVVISISSEDMTFQGRDFAAFFTKGYGKGEEQVQELCAQMVAAGVFISVSDKEQAFAETKYQFTSAFQRFITIPQRPAEAAKPSRLKPADSLERLICIFRETPPDASEREVETRNFVREGMHFFYPLQVQETIQDRLVSSVITFVNVLSQLTAKASQPSKETGSPIVRIGNANIVMEPLTTTDQIELTVHLALGSPDGSADHQTRSLALSFKDTMRFIHGPTNDLIKRLPEHALKQELTRVGLELQKLINSTVLPLPAVKYTQSQTSILAYRLGGKCAQSTLGTFARAHRLIGRIMQYPHVMGAAVFSDTKVVVHEMTEGILGMVQHVVETSKARDGAWLSPSNQETPYHPGGLSNVLFDPVRYGYVTKRTETVGRSTATEICSYLTVFISHEQIEELKLATMGAVHSQPSETELPDPLLPSYLTEDYPSGKYYGLYIQHQDSVSTAVLVPVQALHMSCCGDTELKDLMGGMMSALSAAPEVTELSDGSYAIYNKMDASFVTSRPNDPHFANECAFAHYFMNSFGDGDVNRLIVSRGPTQHHFTSRSFAGIQTFYQSPVLSGANRKMSVAENKASDYLSPHPCLL